MTDARTSAVGLFGEVFAMDHKECGQLRTVRLFARQHGVLHRHQALAAGLSVRQVEWLLKTGVWIAVHRGVY